MKYELPNMGGSTMSNDLTRRMIAELHHGEYSQCDRLPSELELAGRFGVSRSVIRDVLSHLEREGFVERGRGIGTIIHRDIVNLSSRLDVKLEYAQLVSAMGYQPTADNVRLYEKTADEELAEKLAIDVGTPVIACEKRVLASGTPVIYSIDHIPVHLFSGKDYRLWDWSRSVFDLLEENAGIVVDTDVIQLFATNASEPVRQQLQVKDGEALIFMDEIGYYKLSSPIIHTLGFYTNFFEFSMLRKRI